MSDERLRKLERAAASEPAGLDARRALAHERLRAGDRRGAFAALAALEREGDDVARRALEALCPRPTERGWGGTSQARCLGPRPTAEVRVGRCELDVPPRRFLASAGTLLAMDHAAERGKGRNVAAIDVATFHPRWAQRFPSASPDRIGLCGDDVVVVSRTTLEVRAAEDGARLRKVVLPSLPTWVIVHGDRAYSAASPIACVDLTAGEVAWTRDLPFVDEPRVGGGLFVARVREGVGACALRLDDGAPVKLAGGKKVTRALAVDARGALVEEGDDRVERDLRNARVARRLGPGQRWRALGDEVVVLVDDRAARLHVLDRRTGATRFTLDGNPGALALSADALWTLGEDGALAAHDLAAGERRASFTLGAAFADAGAALLAPLDGGALVATNRGTTVHVARVES